jgi:hypothetical protein
MSLFHLIQFGATDRFITSNATLDEMRRRHRNVEEPPPPRRYRLWDEVEVEVEVGVEVEEAEYRLITAADKNQECPVTLCNIEKGDKYCICSTCKHNFSAAAVATIKKNTYTLKCPLCRSPWTKAGKRIYINNVDAEDELQDAVRFAHTLLEKVV